MANYKYGVIVDGKLAFNSLVYATSGEADDAARELMGRWYVPTGYEVVETDKAVNYTFDWTNGNKRVV